LSHNGALEPSHESKEAVRRLNSFDPSLDLSNVLELNDDQDVYRRP